MSTLMVIVIITTVVSMLVIVSDASIYNLYSSHRFLRCNEAEMMLALVNYGPLAIAIKVKEDLMFYKSGIYSPTGQFFSM